MKMFLMCVAVAGFLLVTSANAQDSTLGQKIKKTAKVTGHAVSKSARAVGNKTAEIASKGAAKVVDKTYKGKEGPHGETIYINEDSKYYYVDKSGHRHYIAEAMLRTKKE